jgi:hypothetical protein
VIWRWKHNRMGYWDGNTFEGRTLNPTEFHACTAFSMKFSMTYIGIWLKILLKRHSEWLLWGHWNFSNILPNVVSAGVWGKFQCTFLCPAKCRANMEVDDTFDKVSISCCISDILLRVKLYSCHKDTASYSLLSYGFLRKH